MAFIMLISCIAQGSFSQASTHILNVEGIRLKSGLQVQFDKCYSRTGEIKTSENIFTGDALLQNVETTADASGFDFGKRTYHKFAVGGHDEYNVELLDRPLHMGDSFKSSYRLVTEFVIEIKYIIDIIIYYYLQCVRDVWYSKSAIRVLCTPYMDV